MEQQFDTSKIGMWLFLATEVLLFGGLFARLVGDSVGLVNTSARVAAATFCGNRKRKCAHGSNPG